MVTRAVGFERRGPRRVASIVDRFQKRQALKESFPGSLHELVEVIFRELTPLINDSDYETNERSFLFLFGMRLSQFLWPEVFDSWPALPGQECPI